MKKIHALLMVCALVGTLRAQSVPTTNFFVLHDDGTAAGSDSNYAGSVIPPGTSMPVAFNFDFTVDSALDRAGFITLRRNLTNPALFDVVDFSLRGFDATLGATLTLARPASGCAGSATTSDTNGSFAPGSFTTITLMADISVVGGGLTGAFPASATITVSGLEYASYYHQTALVTGAIPGVLGPVLSLHIKEDAFVPGIGWEMVADSATSSASVGGGPSAVRGAFTLIRNSNDYTTYTLTDMALVAATPVATTISAVAGGTMTLDPVTRGVSGTLQLLVNGVPVTRVLDGVGESFTGSATQPTSIHIDEVNVPGLDHLILDLTRPCITVASGAFQVNATTQITMRGRPGDVMAIGASFLVPPEGINTPHGDVLVSADALLDFSLAAGNGVFVSNIQIVPPSGATSMDVVVPNVPALAGFTAFLAGATFDSGSLAIHSVTNSMRMILSP